MKKNKKAMKRADKKAIVKNQSVDVARKKDVVLVKSCIDKLTEDEIRELLISVARENKEMKAIYYAMNTQVIKTRQRSFGDLIKKFMQQVGDTMTVKKQRRIVKYR